MLQPSCGKDDGTCQLLRDSSTQCFICSCDGCLNFHGPYKMCSPGVMPCQWGCTDYVPSYQTIVGNGITKLQEGFNADL